MNDRERFRRVMHFESADRVPYWELMGIDRAAVVRWRREGMPADVHLETYFQRDDWRTAPLDDGLVPGYMDEVLDFEDGVVTRRDHLGRVLRERDGRLIEVASYPLATAADLAEVRTRLNPRSPRRYPRHWADFVRSIRDRSYPLGVNVRSPVRWFIDLAGPARLAELLDEEPKLVEDALDVFTDFTIDVLRPMLAGVADLDFMMLRETLSGEALTAGVFSDLIAPRYSRLVKAAADHAVDVVILVCPGDVRALVGTLMEAGITALAPLTAEAGMNPLALRREHGQALALIGGIDTRVLAQDHETIEREVRSKAAGLLSGGGWIPCLDATVSADVPLENYQFCWELIRDLAEAG